MWIVVGILALPLVEIGLFVTLGAKLGLWLTLAWVLATGVGGVLLLRGMALAGRQGLRGQMRDGLHDPLSPLAHKALIGVAGVLLILPGFLTDTLGLLLLVPPVRGLVIRAIAGRVRGIAVVQRGQAWDEPPIDHEDPPARGFSDRLR